MRRAVAPGGYCFRTMEQAGCIFIHIPKCAGVSLCRALLDGTAGGHTTLREYKLVFEPETFRRLFKFTVVRNPWDRLVSAFFFLKAGGMDASDRRWAERNLAEVPDFEHFVKRWLDKQRIESYPHLKPQYRFIQSELGDFPLDFVGLFENLDDDFARIASHLGTDARLPHANKARRGDFRRYYDSSMVDKVAGLYARDIDLLGYRFDNGNLEQLLQARDRLFPTATADQNGSAP